MRIFDSVTVACLIGALDATSTIAFDELTPKLHQAITRGVKVIERAAENYPKHRKCFSCHHQTLPLLGLTVARDAGFEIDAKILESQLEFTRKSFSKQQERLKTGQHIGGWAGTVSYGLWTLDLLDEQPDELSADMLTYLLKTQGERGFWRAQSIRPPLEESRVSCTVLSAYSLQQFCSQEQQAEIQEALNRAKNWLALTKLKSHEDYVGRFSGLALLGGEEEEIATARQEIIERQNEDGGWGQIDDAESDAYATGQTIYVLLQAGSSTEDDALKRAIEFLLSTQEEGGSWHVKTRSKPVQVFFDNGDPHGKDQFISVAATGWAVAALATELKLREMPKGDR